jgi:hypothetical protein
MNNEGVCGKSSWIAGPDALSGSRASVVGKAESEIVLVADKVELADADADADGADEVCA